MKTKREDSDGPRVINRKNSWSRMRILQEMLEYICSNLEMEPCFLTLACGFCSRSASYDQTFIGFYNTAPFADGSFEICYNLRFFEPHGRQAIDPWSCRQSAIYQKCLPGTNHVAWILIQPPNSFRDSFQDHQLKEDGHPLRLHVRYIRSCTHHWRDYLNDKDSTLLDLTAKFSSGKPLLHFDVNFTTFQRILSIRTDMHLALAIIDGTESVISRLVSHVLLLCDVLRLSPLLCISLKTELDQILAEVKVHRSAIKRLLKLSKDLCFTNQQVLNLRNQDMLVNNGNMLTQLGNYTAEENRIISKAINETSRDSRTMKIATVVAMFYLPANLVLAFFGTNFVGFQSSIESAGKNSGAKMTVHAQAWIAAVISLLLAVLTILLLIAWDKRLLQKKVLFHKVKLV